MNWKKIKIHHTFLQINFLNIKKFIFHPLFEYKEIINSIKNTWGCKIPWEKKNSCRVQSSQGKKNPSKKILVECKNQSKNTCGMHPQILVGCNTLSKKYMCSAKNSLKKILVGAPPQKIVMGMQSPILGENPSKNTCGGAKSVSINPYQILNIAFLCLFKKRSQLKNC